MKISSTEVRKDILFKRSKCFSRYVFRFYCPVDFNDVKGNSAVEVSLVCGMSNWLDREHLIFAKTVFI